MRPVFFGRRHHLDAFFGGVRHGFFDVDVLARVDRVHHHLLVPMVGNGGHDAIDVLVLQQFVIAPGGGQVWTDDLLCQSVAAVIKVAGGCTFHPRQLDRVGQQSRALHADSDHAKPHSIAGGRGLGQGPERIRIQHDGLNPQSRASCCAQSNEFTPRETVPVH